MKISDATSMLEDVLSYKDSFEIDDPGTLALRSQLYESLGDEELQEYNDSLKTLDSLHDRFYCRLECLHEIMVSPPPQPSDYGKNAKKWLQSGKSIETGVASLLGSMPLLIGGGFAGIPEMVLGGSGLLVLGMLGAYQGHKQSKQIHKSEKAKSYINDLATYHADINHCLGDFSEELLDVAQSYLTQLEKVVVSMNKVDLGYDEEYVPLLQQANTLENFIESYPLIKKSLHKKEKLLSPHNTCISSEIDLLKNDESLKTSKKNIYSELPPTQQILLIAEDIFDLLKKHAKKYS